jgi:hypothetical protein
MKYTVTPVTNCDSSRPSGDIIVLSNDIELYDPLFVPFTYNSYCCGHVSASCA